MRESLLGRDPEIHPVTIEVLVGIADRIERESVQRYATLVDVMVRRGEAATAAALRYLLEEERRHVDAVQHWAGGLGQSVPPAEGPGAFTWQLPADLSTSWDEIAGTSRLTPYRAFAIAVENEQRAFELYSYLAAHAEEPRVAREAERLAVEELRHAALMRRWRRQAWHRERAGTLPAAPASASTADELHRLLARHEAVIAARHRALAARLRAAGDGDSAALLEELLRSPSWPAGEADVPPPDELPGDDPVHLLVAAQEPLEALSEALEHVMRALEGELFAEAERALGNVVKRLSRIALQAADRMQPA